MLLGRVDGARVVRRDAVVHEVRDRGTVRLALVPVARPVFVRPACRTG